jgi:hypothetical protein
VVGVLQLLPIFPTLEDIAEIQTVLHWVITIANVVLAPIRTIPSINRAEYNFAFMRSVSFLNPHTVSPYA